MKVYDSLGTSHVLTITFPRATLTSGIPTSPFRAESSDETAGTPYPIELASGSLNSAPKASLTPIPTPIAGGLEVSDLATAPPAGELKWSLFGGRRAPPDAVQPDLGAWRPMHRTVRGGATRAGRG